MKARKKIYYLESKERIIMSSVLIRGVDKSTLLLIDELADDNNQSRNELLQEVLFEVAQGRVIGDTLKKRDEELRTMQKIISELIETVSKQTTAINQLPENLMEKLVEEK